MDICEKYNIQLPMQIAFDNWKQEPTEYINEILGEERNNRLNPVKAFMERKCVVSFVSDTPCTNPDPIVWLYKACNHSNPNQSITIQEALRAATYNGYYTTFDETKRGSLEVGKIVNMVILSDNPYTMNKKDLLELKAEKTILNGKKLLIKTKSYKVKRAIFMCAGFGSRMVPVTLTTPKPLVKVNGVRIIDRLIDALLAQGIDEIIIVRGYLKHKFNELKVKYPMIKFVDNDLYNESNNIYSIYLVRDKLEDAYIFEGDLVLSNPNIITKHHESSDFFSYTS